jgi:hypothetical protein
MEWPISHDVCRYSTIYVADCEQFQASVIVKAYDMVSCAPKKQRMATREAIMLKHLNSLG